MDTLNDKLSKLHSDDLHMDKKRKSEKRNQISFNSNTKNAIRTNVKEKIDNT